MQAEGSMRVDLKRLVCLRFFGQGEGIGDILKLLLF